MASVRELSKLLVDGIDGADWYARAYATIREEATFDCGVDIIADVLALVSPRKTVADSVRIARHYLRTGELIDVARSVRKQFEHWQATGTIRGPKCEAFARALKGDSSACVIDTWILKALRLPPGTNLRSKRMRERIGSRFATLSKPTGLTVAQCQACVWFGIIRKHGGKPAYLAMTDATRSSTNGENHASRN